MIVEFFGLSNSGKSVLKKELENKGHKVLKFENFSALSKTGFLAKSFIRHPLRNLFLFAKTNSNALRVSLPFKGKISSFLMRNSYLSSVLAKEELLKSLKEEVFTDEYSFQSIFMILQKKSSEKEIRRLLAYLPKSDFLIVFRGNKALREKAYKVKHPFRKGTLLPGSNISPEYGKAWMESMEHNFRIIEKIALDDYRKTEKFSGLKKAMEKINRDYKKKNKLKVTLSPPKIYKLR